MVGAEVVGAEVAKLPSFDSTYIVHVYFQQPGACCVRLMLELLKVKISVLRKCLEEGPKYLLTRG